MLLGGYAGFFGLWRLAKEFLSKRQVVLWAALLVLISLVSFIVFDRHHKLNPEKSRFFRSPKARSNQAELLKHLNQMVSDEESGSRRFMCFWETTTAVVLGTALAAAIILGWAFVVLLLKSS